MTATVRYLAKLAGQAAGPPALQPPHRLFTSDTYSPARPPGPAGFPLQPDAGAGRQRSTGPSPRTEFYPADPVAADPGPPRGIPAAADPMSVTALGDPATGAHPSTTAATPRAALSASSSGEPDEFQPLPPASLMPLSRGPGPAALAEQLAEQEATGRPRGAGTGTPAPGVPAPPAAAGNPPAEREAEHPAGWPRGTPSPAGPSAAADPRPDVVPPGTIRARRQSPRHPAVSTPLPTGIASGEPLAGAPRPDLAAQASDQLSRREQPAPAAPPAQQNQAARPAQPALTSHPARQNPATHPPRQGPAARPVQHVPAAYPVPRAPAAGPKVRPAANRRTRVIDAAPGLRRTPEPSPMGDALPPAGRARPPSAGRARPSTGGPEPAPHGPVPGPRTTGRPSVSIGTIEVTVLPSPAMTVPQPPAPPTGQWPRPASGLSDGRGGSRLRAGLRRWYGIAQG